MGLGKCRARRALESVGFASASVAALERADCAPAALKQRPFRAPSQVQRYIVPLSLSSPHLRLPLLSAAGAQSVFRGGAASTATARPFRAQRHLPRRSRHFRAKRHLPRRSAPTLSSEATLAEALCADTLKRRRRDTFFRFFFIWDWKF